ncbi:MAG: hypothetical protein OCD76_07955 [Reichenbachiella sp.]
MKKLNLLLLISILSFSLFAQNVDSTQIGKEYPHLLPILGKKAYAKGYKLQKPLGMSVGTIFNKQGLILEDFEMAIADPGTPTSDIDYINLNGTLDFGPSEGRINTLNFRADAWVFPFLSVGAYYGKIWGEQTISFSFMGSDFFESTTDIVGQYYGLNLLGLVPLGPVVLMADYSWSWTTNENLDEPVLVKVSGMRVVRRIMTKKEGRFFAVWGGAQFQNLDNRTSGNIALDEALGISEEDKDAYDDHWINVQNDEVVIREDVLGRPVYWSDLTQTEQDIRQNTHDLVRGIADDDVYYKFDKRLEYKWNMLLGVNYQHSDKLQIRTEYGFLKSKQQLMFMVSYRFGF